MSLLNHYETTAPKDIADLLINTINLRYHPQVMALCGQDAVAEAEAVYNQGNYVLVLEGGVPTNFGGAACWAWTYNDQEVTLLEAVKTLAAKAKARLAVGTCASFGGIAAAAPNPAGIKSLAAATGLPAIHIAGCPPHPQWIVWTIAQLLIGGSLPLDGNRRPTAIYGRTVHDQCPRRGTEEADFLGTAGCLKELGCRGPKTRCNCPKMLFNNKVNWCIGANAPCIGCTEPSFSGPDRFYRQGEGGGHDD